MIEPKAQEILLSITQFYMQKGTKEVKPFALDAVERLLKYDPSNLQFLMAKGKTR
jgi:hypothetical protein